jgi:hypothetical protein
MRYRRRMSGVRVSTLQAMLAGVSVQAEAGG